MTKWCGDLWGWGFLGGDFLGEHSELLGALGFLGVGILEALGAARSAQCSDFLRVVDFWAIAFLGALGAARSALGGEGGDILGIIFDWFCRIFGLGSFVL